MKNLVSVIMCTYNEEICMLEKSINSVLEQTYNNIEFIIINDNPKNLEIIEYLHSLDDKRIRVFYNENNIKQAKSRNVGIKYAHGEYIAIMDADDIAERERISKQKEYYDNNKCDILGSFYLLIDENDKKIGRIILPTRSENIKKLIMNGINCFANPTLFTKKEILEKLNGYRDIDYCEDYDLLLRAILKSYRISNTKDFLLQYRIRTESTSNRNISKQYLTMKYLSNNVNKIDTIDNKDINNNISSSEIQKYDEFINLKNNFKKKKNIKKITQLLFNKYSYIKLFAKIYYFLIIINERLKCI